MPREESADSPLVRDPVLDRYDRLDLAVENHGQIVPNVLACDVTESLCTAWRKREFDFVVLAAADPCRRRRGIADILAAYDYIVLDDDPRLFSRPITVGAPSIERDLVSLGGIQDQRPKTLAQRIGFVKLARCPNRLHTSTEQWLEPTAQMITFL